MPFPLINSVLVKEAMWEKVLKMCRLAREYGVPLCLNSDAHIHLDVGNIEPLAEIINMAGLKKEDVLNTSVETIERFLAEKKTVECTLVYFLISVLQFW